MGLELMSPLSESLDPVVLERLIVYDKACRRGNNYDAFGQPFSIPLYEDADQIAPDVIVYASRRR